MNNYDNNYDVVLDHFANGVLMNKREVKIISDALKLVCEDIAFKRIQSKQEHEDSGLEYTFEDVHRIPAELNKMYETMTALYLKLDEELKGKLEKIEVK